MGSGSQAMKQFKLIGRSGGCVGALFSALLLSTSVEAQPVDPEWPCIQRLIMEVSPAVLWPVPVEEDMASLYKKDAEVRALSEQLGDIEQFTDTHRTMIAEFAQAKPESEREQQLTLLAVGVLDVSNRIRADYIRGIKRYTRQQIAISEQIEATLNELSLLEDANTTSSGHSREDVVETLRWHERVYDQRERSIQMLCERPVELEQRVSDVLRDAVQYLP